MATTDLGLFGLTPEDYQQAQLEKARANAIEMAKLDPMQRAEAGLRTAGYQLGGGIAGLMGVEDPRLKQISEMQGLLKGIDPTDPTSYFNAAKMSSNPQLAAMLIQRGQAVQKGTLEAAKINAEISAKLSEKMPNEQKLAAAIADTSGAARGTPEWTATYKKQLDRLTSKEVTPREIKVVGVAQGTNYPVYMDQNTNEQFTFVKGPDGKQTRQPYAGGVDRKTASTNVSVSEKRDTAWEVELAKEDVKYLADIRQSRDSSKASLNSLEQLKSLDDQGLMGGAFSKPRIGVANILNSIGILSKSDATALANSQNYNASIQKLALDILNGKLGAGISNQDAERIAQMLPQLETSAQARRELISIMSSSYTKKFNEAQTAIDYARKNKGFAGYRPSIPLVTSSKDISNMSTEELINIAKGAK